jgi:hypothetical protein
MPLRILAYAERGTSTAAGQISGAWRACSGSERARASHCSSPGSDNGECD